MLLPVAAKVTGNTRWWQRYQRQRTKTNITAFNLTGSNVNRRQLPLGLRQCHWQPLGRPHCQRSCLVLLQLHSVAALLSTGPNSANTSNTNVNDNTNINNTNNNQINNKHPPPTPSPAMPPLTNNTTGGNATSGNANSAVNLLNVENSSLDLKWGWFGHPVHQRLWHLERQLRSQHFSR